MIKLIDWLIKRLKKARERFVRLRNKRNALVCALVGHSKIQAECFGYFTCARCGTQLGDALGGYYNASDVVIVGHGCGLCHENYKKLGWKDKLFCPDPFKEAQG